MTNDKITPVQEDYLEAIFFLTEKGRVVRSKDISNQLNAHKSTVSNNLRVLQQQNLVSFEPYGLICLSDKGFRIAERVASKHRLLKDFLQNILLLDETTAENNACRIEHVVDAEVIERLSVFIAQIHTCPDSADSCISQFAQLVENFEHGDNQPRQVPPKPRFLKE